MNSPYFLIIVSIVMFCMPIFAFGQSSQNIQIKADLTSIRQLATAIYKIDRNYDRVCGNIGKSQDPAIRKLLVTISTKGAKQIICGRPSAGTATGYAISLALNPTAGTPIYYCIDSKGYSVASAKNIYPTQTTCLKVPIISNIGASVINSTKLALATPSPTWGASPTPTPTWSPSPTVTPTPWVTSSPTPSGQPTPTQILIPTPTATLSPRPTPVITTTPTTVTAPGLKQRIFMRSLYVGTRGSDVKALQVFLNNHNTIIAPTGSGSKGLETQYFGNATKSALSKWQKENGLSVTGVLDNDSRQTVVLDGLTVLQYSSLQKK